MSYQINGGDCVGCGSCEEVCPAGCIQTIMDIRIIHEAQCLSCGECVKICPVRCIEQTADK